MAIIGPIWYYKQFKYTQWNGLGIMPSFRRAFSIDMGELIEFIYLTITLLEFVYIESFIY